MAAGSSTRISSGAPGSDPASAAAKDSRRVQPGRRVEPCSAIEDVIPAPRQCRRLGSKGVDRRRFEKPQPPP